MRKSISMLLTILMTVPNVAMANSGYLPNPLGGGSAVYNSQMPGGHQCGYPSEEGGYLSEDEEKLEALRLQLERVESNIETINDRYREIIRGAKRILTEEVMTAVKKHQTGGFDVVDYGACPAAPQGETVVPCVQGAGSGGAGEAATGSPCTSDLDDEYDPTILELIKIADAKADLNSRASSFADRAPASPPGRTDDRDAVCPTLNAAPGTHTFPNCQCATGYVFNQDEKSCDRRPQTVTCPTDASGTHPNCVCIAPKVYAQATNSCENPTAPGQQVQCNPPYERNNQGGCSLIPVTSQGLCPPGRTCPPAPLCARAGFSGDEVPPAAFCTEGGCPMLLNLFFEDGGEVNGEALCNAYPQHPHLFRVANPSETRREECVDSLSRSRRILANLTRLKAQRRTLERKISDAEACMMDQEIDDLIADNDRRGASRKRKSCVGNTEGGRREGRGGDRSRLGGWELAGMIGLGLAGIAGSYYGTKHIVDTNTQLGWPNDPYMAQMPWHIAAQGMYGIALGNQIRGGYGCVGGGAVGPGGALGYPGGYYGQAPYGGIMMGGPFGGGYPGMGGGMFMGGGIYAGGGGFAGGGVFAGGGIYAGGGYPGGYAGGYPGGFAGGGVFAGGGIYAGGGFPGGYAGGYPGGFAGGGAFAGGGGFPGGFQGGGFPGGFAGGGAFAGGGGFPGGGGYMGADFQLQMMQQYQQQVTQWLQQEQSRLATQAQAQQTVARLTAEMQRIQAQIVQISYGAQYGTGYSTGGSGGLLTNPLDPTAPIGR